MQEGKDVLQRNTNLGDKTNNSSRFSKKHEAYLLLTQVHNAIRHAARLGVQQDALLALQLADPKKIVPAIGLQARKHSARDDQVIKSIEITLKVAGKFRRLPGRMATRKPIPQPYISGRFSIPWYPASP